ncbi:MAG: DUF2290 domain-containing protein [Flavobacteriaceae bacterium]|nr:DUF2290 domain-containing protein [Flavobacteriaceae bacterium]
MQNNANTITRQITSITSILIEAGISVCQNFPSHKNGDVSFEGKDKISIALKNIPYINLYAELLNAKCYNMKLLDGALIQLMYRFHDDKIISHRLSFFPSPYLEDYQNALEAYENDELYGDVVRDNIMPFPIRFDFSNEQKIYKEIYHSKTHLTLGEFCHCRIPVSSPLLPIEFISFIIRHLYFEDRNAIINQKLYNMEKTPFQDNISGTEKAVSYFSV